LRDDGILYGEILQKAGVDVAIMTSHGQLHDSVLFEAVRAGATPRAAVSLIATQLKAAFKATGVVEVSAKGRGKRLRDGSSEGNTDLLVKNGGRKKRS
jgi:acetyl esterase